MKRYFHFCCFLTIAASFILLSGCSRKIVSEIVTVHDTVYQSATNVEKQYQHDSIYIDRWHTEWLQGDTVHHRDSIYFHVEKTVHDTVQKTDTVYRATTNNQTTNTTEQAKQKKQPVGWIFFAGILTASLCFLGVKFLLSKWQK